MQLLLSLASLALAIGTRISVRSHTGASTTSSRIGPVGEPWQMGMKYACMQKWKAGGFRSEGKYVDEFCLVDLDKAHLLASLHLQFAETLDKCVSKKKGSHKMRLCAVKGEKPDGRLSYNTRTYVPKSCFRESPTERAYPVIEGAATEELCSFMAKSHSIQSQGQFGQAIPKEDKKIAALPASACPGGVSFITDIEGDLDWFQNIVSISKALKWSGDHTDGMPGKHLALKEGACFVFGGDLFDRGPGDIRLARELVHLKEEFPDRVFLLVANRDLNKLRLASELSDACLALPANECTNAVYGKEKADSDPLVSKLNLVDRVKWILQFTLSAGKTFEERRKELSLLKGGNDVDDLETAQSFKDMVTPPNGIIFRFLEKGQLGIRIGETLFVPGSIPPDALLFVPSLDLRYTDKKGKKEDVPGTYLPSDTSLDTWLEELNKFESAAMAAYKEKPMWEAPLDSFGGESLLCYQSPSCVVNKAVVTESLYNRGTVQDSWGESAQYGKVADFLKKHGVKQFCTGGKPTGHMPLVTKVEEITVIMADTSYSDDSFYDVFIQRDGKFLVEGELHSKEEHGTKVSFSSADVEQGLIGTKTVDGFWVQGKTEKGYHLFKQVNRDKEYKFVADTSEVAAKALPDLGVAKDACPSCKDGFVSEKFGDQCVCRPAPCEIMGTVNDGPSCECMVGLIGHITWVGAKAEGDCIAEAKNLFSVGPMSVWKHKGKEIKCCVSTVRAPTQLQDMTATPLPSKGHFGRNSRVGCGYMFGDHYHNGMKPYKSRAYSTCPVSVAKLVEASGESFDDIKKLLSLED